jgi:hypothetical protein
MNDGKRMSRGLGRSMCMAVKLLGLAAAAAAAAGTGIVAFCKKRCNRQM